MWAQWISSEHHTQKLKAESVHCRARPTRDGNTQVLADITKGIEDIEQIARQRAKSQFHYP
jgi:hypothetical protein